MKKKSYDDCLAPLERTILVYKMLQKKREGSKNTLLNNSENFPNLRRKWICKSMKLEHSITSMQKDLQET